MRYTLKWGIREQHLSRWAGHRPEAIEIQISEAHFESKTLTAAKRKAMQLVDRDVKLRRILSRNAKAKIYWQDWTAELTRDSVAEQKYGVTRIAYMIMR